MPRTYSFLFLYASCLWPEGCWSFSLLTPNRWTCLWHTRKDMEGSVLICWSFHVVMKRRTSSDQMSDTALLPSFFMVVIRHSLHTRNWNIFHVLPIDHLSLSQAIAYFSSCYSLRTIPRTSFTTTCGRDSYYTLMFNTYRINSSHTTGYYLFNRISIYQGQSGSTYIQFHNFSSLQPPIRTAATSPLSKQSTYYHLHDRLVHYKNATRLSIKHTY